MVEFTVGDHQYRSGKLNAFQQFHVVRKLGPIFIQMGPGALDLTVGQPLLAPALDALAQMPEDDCNYVLQTCLSVVQRYQGSSAWVSVWNARAKAFQFEDIDLSSMMQITVQVLTENLSNFLNAPAPTSTSPRHEGSNTQQNSSPFLTAKTG